MWYPDHDRPGPRLAVFASTLAVHDGGGAERSLGGKTPEDGAIAARNAAEAEHAAAIGATSSTRGRMPGSGEGPGYGPDKQRLRGKGTGSPGEIGRNAGGRSLASRAHGCAGKDRAPGWGQQTAVSGPGLGWRRASLAPGAAVASGTALPGKFLPWRHARWRRPGSTENRRD